MTEGQNVVEGLRDSGREGERESLEKEVRDKGERGKGRE